MSEPGRVAEPDGQRGALPTDAFGRTLFRLSECVALLGGAGLLVVTALTVVSVIGRGGFNAPLLGDSEIVEVGCAVAIFAFLPYCQMRGANVIVDFFTMGASRRTRAVLDTVMHVVFLACVAVLVWRLALGGLGAYRSGDNSMFLRIPLWWGYLAGLTVSAVWLLTCVHSVVRHARSVRTTAAGRRLA